MKRILLFCFLTICATTAFAQTTYYWVGGFPSTPQAVNVAANWNTALDGTGSTRASSSGAGDILIFDGSNIGGTNPTTGSDTVNLAGSITCAQMKFINNTAIVFVRNASGTSTITLSGEAGEDFVIESGSSLALNSSTGSNVIVLSAGGSGRVSGNFSMVTTLQARIANGTSTATTLVFKSGSTFRSNITSTSAAYPFGNSSQSTEKWVTFEPGSTYYYDGGYSAMGSNSTFQPINFEPGSNFVMRVSNPVGSYGSFFNRKDFANITVQNGATLTADGPVNGIDTLTITSGSTFTTHTSGQTVVLGDVVVHGTLGSSSTSTNELVMAGTTQSISGTGTITVGSLMLSSTSNLKLNKNITVNQSATINGKVDFGTFQITGDASFTAKGASTAITASGNLAGNSYLITGATGITGISRGISISGTGLSPNTSVVSYTTNLDSIYISKPALATATGVALALSSPAASLITSNPNGFDNTTGSVIVTATKTYGDELNYTFNAATTKPFGISSGFTSINVNIGSLAFNADATTNISAIVSGILQSNGKITIRGVDTLRLLSSATLAGSFNSSNYFITDVNGTGQAGVFSRDGVAGATLFPVGTSTNYLPVTVNPVIASGFAINVFQGITKEGTLTGTPLTSTEKQTVVDAVWSINRTAGSGDANVQLQWTSALEGTTLATFANSEIGIIKNNGTSWSLPFGVGDNALNITDTVFSVFGQFSVGARPPLNPFLFNPLPPKTYGDADFSPGVISSNTTTIINYTSSNTAVATIVGNNIHITGSGTTTVTASQATDGFYPAANVSQTLTVSKASLTITADRKVKPEGDPNPPLTVTYTGFVYNETPAVLVTPVSIATTATASSPAGSYLIAVSGATAANYTISFVNDSLIVRPRSAQSITFAAPASRTYGAADFAIGATSTNSSIPVTYASSNISVATIVGNNIHIVSAGTTTITVSQAGSDLFFPAPNVSRTFTVNKAPLTIRVADTTKIQGQPNPAFRIVYTGFVSGEGATVFTTQPSITTTAGTNSAPGYYTLEPAGTVAANYNITYVPGRLTTYPSTGTTQANLQAFVSNSNTLTVRIFSSEPDLADVMVYDINGRPVAKKNVFLAPGFITATFAIDYMPSGIYVLQVEGKKTSLKLTTPIIH